MAKCKEIKCLILNELTWESGFDYLLAAFSKVVNNVPHKLTLTIVGGGPFYGIIKYTIKDLNISKNVILINKIPDNGEMFDLIENCDIYFNFCVKYKTNPGDKIALVSNKSIICSDVNILLAKKKYTNVQIVTNRNIDKFCKKLSILVDTFDF